MKQMISLKQAEELIATVGKEVTVHLRGQPGIGKSSILNTLAGRFPDHIPVYIDCADLDLGDLAMPAMNHESKTTAFYPNERFNLQHGKPVIIMLDEITKASEPVKNMLLPVMLERRLGSVKFHPESIVYSTGNLTTDGVGDTMKAHAKNRLTAVNVANPTDDEWINWGVDNGIAPEVLAWVKQFPHCLAMYTDDSQKENMYIFNPRKQQEAFVSPRSLAKASSIVKNRDVLGEDTTLTALMGTIGEAAARDMSAYFSLADGLPTKEAIYKEPEKASVPKDPAAKVILVMRELMTITEEHMDAWMKYLQRLPMETQALFAVNIMASTRKSIAATNKSFVNWAVANNQYF
jgi:energy-coupling factor transporter ATP-binding protein EcfA2